LKRSIHFTSESNEWSTPQDLFDRLNEEFKFTLDAAATPENAKCEKFFTYIENGLAQSWRGERVWLNPPYGSDLGRWVEKAVFDSSEVTVMLVPARTDTQWWSLFWDYDKHRAAEGCEVRFLKGRLKFGGGKQMRRSRQQSSCSEKDAPFASAIVILRKVDGTNAR
jgi:phage N-6-adenine-methyltransferase